MIVKELIEVIPSDLIITIKPSGKRVYYDGVVSDIPDNLLFCEVIEMSAKCYYVDDYYSTYRYKGFLAVWVNSIISLDEKADEKERQEKTLSKQLKIDSKDQEIKEQAELVVNEIISYHDINNALHKLKVQLDDNSVMFFNKDQTQIEKMLENFLQASELIDCLESVIFNASYACKKELAKMPVPCYKEKRVSSFCCPTCTNKLLNEQRYCDCCGQHISWIAIS